MDRILSFVTTLSILSDERGWWLVSSRVADAEGGPRSKTKGSRYTYDSLKVHAHLGMHYEPFSFSVINIGTDPVMFRPKTSLRRFDVKLCVLPNFEERSKCSSEVLRAVNSTHLL